MSCAHPKALRRPSTTCAAVECRGCGRFAPLPMMKGVPLDWRRPWDDVRDALATVVGAVRRVPAAQRRRLARRAVARLHADLDVR